MSILNRKRVYIIVLFLITMIAFVIVRSFNKYSVVDTQNATELHASGIIELASLGIENGFTCTGIGYDISSDSFFVGDAGKMTPDDKVFRAKIRQISRKFDTQLSSIDVYNTFSAIKDVQGVTVDKNGVIWFCSYGENLIRAVDMSGKEVSSFRVRRPSGIAYVEKENCLWVLTNRKLLKYSMDGNKLNQIMFKVPAQDQLFYENDTGLLYITAGADYHGDSYVYTFDTVSEEFSLRYILKDSFAIEGIFIIDGVMYILNDGLYHSSTVAVNQVNVYNVG